MLRIDIEILGYVSNNGQMSWIFTRTTSPPVYPIDNSWTNSLAPRSQQPASPRPLQPVSPLFPQQSNPLSSQPVNRGGQPISNQRRTIVGSDGWLYTRTGFSFQQPFGNTGNSSIVPLNPTNNIPLSASDVPVANTDFFGGRAPITEANVASNGEFSFILIWLFGVRFAWQRFVLSYLYASASDRKHRFNNTRFFKTACCWISCTCKPNYGRK